jgi:predicted transcriptional regulator of viral defense system
MSADTDYVARPLSRRESQVMAWLEEERPRVITAEDLAQAFSLSRETATDVLRRMADKGWLQRVAQGSYGPLLADTGGIALPNPWAALAAWKAPYYVSYGAAAYELDLTPDRPGTITACVRPGTRKPARLAELPIELVPQRHFSLWGSEPRDVRGVQVRMAGVERLLLDSAIRPSRVGGVIALGRIVHRASDADWALVVSLAEDHPRGRAGARRLAALHTVLERPVPAPLERFASSHLPRRPMPLDDPDVYGWRGATLGRFAVLLNVPAESIREEIRR